MVRIEAEHQKADVAALVGADGKEEAGADFGSRLKAQGKAQGTRRKLLV